MAATFAGILGLVAFVATLARGLVHAAGFESTVLAALVALAVFAAIGGLTGLLTDAVLQDAVRTSVAAELAQGAAARDRDQLQRTT